MQWVVSNHEAFEDEYDALPPTVRFALLAELMLLRTYGPALGRPHVDTLSGSQYANMKELRFNAGGGVAFEDERWRTCVVSGRNRARD